MKTVTFTSRVRCKEEQVLRMDRGVLNQVTVRR